MERETIKNILEFLKEKENKPLPFYFMDKYNIIKALENHPDNVKCVINKSLFLSESNIEKLPNILHVRGDLWLNNCKQLTELPDNLYVYGSLMLEDNKQINKFPNTLFVAGDLWLIKTNIEKLPKQIFVGEDLLIQGTPLADKYTDEELYEMAESLEGGKIRGKIIR